MSPSYLFIPEPLKSLQVYKDHSLLSSYFDIGIPLPPSLEVIAAIETITSRVDWDEPISRIWEVMFRLQILDQAKDHLCPVTNPPSLGESLLYLVESFAEGTECPEDCAGSVVGRQAGKRFLANLESPIVDLDEKDGNPNEGNTVALLVQPLTDTLTGLCSMISRSASDVDTILIQNDRTAMQVASLSADVVASRTDIGSRITSMSDDLCKRLDSLEREVGRTNSQIEKVSRQISALSKETQRFVRASKRVRMRKNACRRCLVVSPPTRSVSSANGSVESKGTASTTELVSQEGKYRATPLAIGWLETFWKICLGGFGELPAVSIRSLDQLAEQTAV